MYDSPVFRASLRFVHRRLTSRTLLLLDEGMAPGPKDVVLRAARHFKPFLRNQLDVKSPPMSALTLYWLAFRSRSILVTGKYRDSAIASLPWCGKIDPSLDRDVAWEWHHAINRTEQLPANRHARAYASFQELMDRLKRRTNLKRCYIFGTGPSLATAEQRRFDDGFLIVCNTIVRDRELVRRIKPDIIVAADALNHFSDTGHATAFREDLKARMRETGMTLCYPEMFETYVRREFAEFNDRCIPLPGGGPPDLTRDLTQDFRLPELGNVLGLIMMPIACSLAKDIRLLGFDGRKEGDKLFWSNSAKHTYPELLTQMSLDYPAFYEKHVPVANPNVYMKVTQGDSLDAAMTSAEKAGWTFTLLAPSTSPALSKRPLEPS